MEIMIWLCAVGLIGAGIRYFARYMNKGKQ
jgi:hypothetical protein